jgi:hypothetical protein
LHAQKLSVPRRQESTRCEISAFVGGCDSTSGFVRCRANLGKLPGEAGPEVRLLMP